MNYRVDIDGLRGVAVIPVVLFHAGYSWIPGGFVGVDLFFVISGYLISSIMIREMKLGQFGFIKFYARRVRRIIPALFFVLLCTLVAGYFFLLPNEYINLSKATLASIGFVPNIYFYTISSTYFGLDIATEPLLHTWSLGVEEQFYILFPALLYFLFRKFQSKTMHGVILFLLCLSLAGNILLAPYFTKFTFYMIPARAWELLIGVTLGLGMVPAIRHKMMAQVAALTGLLLIAGSMFMLNEYSVFPGMNAVYPVLGAALVIHANTHHSTLASWLLSRHPLVLVGMISYSLYLWHWPVTVYTKMLDNSRFDSAFIVLFYCLLSVLSYRFIENRYRRPLGNMPVRRIRHELAVVGTLATTGTVIILLGHGLGYRIPEKAMNILLQKPDRLAAVEPDCRVFNEVRSDDLDSDEKGQLCQLGMPNSPAQFVIWGDSHAKAISPALHQAALDAGVAGYSITSDGCRPLAGVYRRHNKRCLLFNNEVLAFIKARTTIRQVFLGGYWRIPLTGKGYDVSNILIADSETQFSSPPENASVFRRGLARTLDALKNRQVFIIEDIPEVGARFGKSAANHFVRQAWLGRENIRELYFHQQADDYQRAFEHVLASLPASRFQLLKVKPWLCKEEQCPLEIHNKLIYHDGDHLSEFGASLLTPAFAEAMQSLATDHDAGAAVSVQPGS